jgi:myo-inositol-1(or 4)-monophosphatase
MSWDPRRIFDLMLEAGAIAVRSKRSLRRELKKDASIVTQVDRELEALISRELEDPARGVHIIGEETVEEKDEDYIQRALREEAYVIDPIDGTSPYAHGLPNWGVSIGRMEAGLLTDGAVYMPEYGEVLLSEGEKVLEGRLEEGSWRWRELGPPRRIEGTSGLIAITQGLAKRGKVLVRNPVQVLGAAVVPLAGLLQERFVAYLGSVKLWDAAGALPLILRAGLSVSVRSGEEFVAVGPAVDGRVYHLEASSRKRWAFRSDLLICHPGDELRWRSALVTNEPAERP